MFTTTQITLISLVVVLFFSLIIVASMVKFVPQSEEWTVERFGKYQYTLQPGLHFLTPFIEQIGSKISRREHVLDIPSQDVITKDNASVHVDGVVFFKVFDTAKAAYEIADLPDAIANLTMTNIRTVIGDIDLDGVLSDRDRINHALLKVIDEATDPWGVKIIRIELKEVRPAADLQAAMSGQMQAEREKRAKILMAEGDRASAIKRAEGESSALRLRAQAEKDALVMKAEGDKARRALEAEARERSAEAEAVATKLMSKAVTEGNVQAINYFVAKKYISALEQMGKAPNNKLVFMPLEASNVIGALGGITTLAKEALGGTESKALAKLSKSLK